MQHWPAPPDLLNIVAPYNSGISKSEDKTDESYYCSSRASARSTYLIGLTDVCTSLSRDHINNSTQFVKIVHIKHMVLFTSNSQKFIFICILSWKPQHIWYQTSSIDHVDGAHCWFKGWFFASLSISFSLSGKGSVNRARRRIGHCPSVTVLSAISFCQGYRQWAVHLHMIRGYALVVPPDIIFLVATPSLKIVGCPEVAYSAYGVPCCSFWQLLYYSGSSFAAKVDKQFQT